MKINHKKIAGLLMALVTVVAVEAQVMPVDKTASKIDFGYGIEQSEFLTTAAATTISGEELQQTSAISLADALYGKLLGLSATQHTGFVGDEGGGAWFGVRGYKTFYDDSILILVDGYERPIDRLTVEEVESVTVLKDPAAVAMLGHEGINGVIYVKTKRGQDGKTQVKVSYGHKFTFDPEFAQMVDAYTYASALNLANRNDGMKPTYTEEELDLFATGTDPHFYPNVNWREMAFNNSAAEDRANLSVTGGNEKVKYYTMLDYTDARGLFKNARFQDFNTQLRYSKANIRANVDFALSPTSKMSVNVLGIFLETASPAGTTADGASWLVYRTPASAFPYKTSTGIWGGNSIYGDGNVVSQIQDSGYEKTHQRQLWADAKIVQDLGFWVEGLSATLAAGYDNASNTVESRSQAHQYGYEYYTDKNNLGSGAPFASTILGDKQSKPTFSYGVASQWRIANTALGLHYKRSFRGDDNFSASALYNTKAEIRDDRNNTFYRVNWMGAFHYDLQNKYMVDLVMAANGSNRSYPAKWAFSPTLSLGYIYADNADNWLSYGKLRASAGIQHTDYVPVAGLWLAQWDASHGGFVYGESYSWGGGSFLSAFPTTDFSQEQTAGVNFGTDLRLWNALDITADVFYSRRSHILLPADMENSYVVGIPSSFSDVGVVDSYGAEFGAKFAKKLGKDLWFNTSAMVTWGTNRIRNVIGEPPYPGVKYVGERVQESYGLEAIGFFADADDIANSPLQEFSQVKPGDIKYKDQNNDGKINQNDYISLNNSNAMPELNYAFSLGVEWKGIGANAVFQGAGGYTRNLLGVSGVWNVLTGNNNLSMDYLNHSWDMVADKADAKFPRFSSQLVQNNTQLSSVWLKDINFLKLRTCEVYYKLPAKTVERIGLGGVKVYVQGQNLWGVDNVEAMDAELLSTGYPVLKSVNLGASITF